MAEIAAAIGINIACHILITSVQNLCKRVRAVKDGDSGGRETKLLQQLNVMESTLKDYQKLEEKGIICFRDQNGDWTTVGSVANTLYECINKCDDFFKQPARMRFWTRSSNKQFDELLVELQNAAKNLNDAMLPILSESK